MWLTETPFPSTANAAADVILAVPATNIAACWPSVYVNGKGLNALMVREGWALAERRFSEKYITDETAAEQANKGLWGMEFMPPWEWRKNQ
ncbi:MAG: hypothetical protein CMF63_05110 [Magnetovibrio sp.]|nr:hypothetical protein [Magnetovibrio sp.]